MTARWLTGADLAELFTDGHDLEHKRAKAVNVLNTDSSVNGALQMHFEHHRGFMPVVFFQVSSAR